MGKTSGTWINTGMFTQIWKKIAEAGEYQKADWVMKLDADAVFIANRMKVWLKQNELVPPAGIYLENCKFVDYGYFGNLEVYSTQAFSTLVQNIDSCKQTLNWKVGVKDGKYGPMGEDLFAQSCLDSVGIRRKEAFDITTDGACPKQAEGGKEEQEVEAKLRICGHSSDASLQEDTGVDPVLRSHHSRLRGMSDQTLSRSSAHNFSHSWKWEFCSKEFSFEHASIALAGSLFSVCCIRRPVEAVEE